MKKLITPKTINSIPVTNNNILPGASLLAALGGIYAMPLCGEAAAAACSLAPHVGQNELDADAQLLPQAEQNINKSPLLICSAGSKLQPIGTG